MKRILLLSILALPLPGAVVSLQLLTPAPTVGQQFDLALVVDGVFDGRDTATDALVAFGLDTAGFTGNPLVSFVGYFSGLEPFTYDDTIAGTSLTGTPDAILLTDADIAGPLTLVIFRFQALQAGIAVLGVSSDIANLNEGLFFLNDPAQMDLGAAAAVTIADAAVPEPETFLLIGFGLLIVGLLRRKL